MSRSRQLNDSVYILKSDFKIVEGKFISKGTQWIYILFNTGNVIGFKEEVVFDKKENAQKVLIERLRTKIIVDKK